MSAKVVPVRSSSTTSIVGAVAAAARAVRTEENGDEAIWIRKQIKKRVCVHFVEKRKDGKSTGLCHCGYKREAHGVGATEGDGDWKPEQHTITMPTDAYGEVQFVGFSQREGRYVRIDHTTDMEVTLELLQNVWNLGTPNLLISVTGGAKNFHMRPKLQVMFRRGLMKAAESTGGWIVTGGMHAGVMKHVGEAVRDHAVAHGAKNKVIALGIVPWGAVNNKEVFISENGKGLWPAQYRTKENRGRVRMSPIDYNHSHFLFVDNGTQHEFGTEIPFRAKLEARVSQIKTTSDKDAVHVPVVCVVLEGGPGTLQTVKSAIQNGTPVVVVQDSGRAADIISYVYEHSTENEVKAVDRFGQEQTRVVSLVESHVWQTARDMIVRDWGNKDIEIRFNWLKECFTRRDHITVFRLDGKNSAKDIDIAILEALLKVHKNRSAEQLQLALAWNRIDVARQSLFNEDRKWAPGELDEAMTIAVRDNRSDFVKLFLDNGLNLKDYLTIKRMFLLYNSIPENTLLRQLLEKERKHKRGMQYGRQFFTFKDVGYVIQKLMGEFYHPSYLRDERYNLTDDQIATILLDEDETPNQVVRHSMKGGAAGPDINNAPRDFDDPNQDLFLFCVLQLWKDIALQFWDDGKEGIAAALVAQKLLKSMENLTEDSELLKSIREQIEMYESLAVGVLSECYASDEARAQLLLVRELPHFGQCTIVQLAVEADNKVFLAHAACQALLNNIWMGRLSTETHVLRMWSCIFCPPLIFALLKYKEDDRKRLQSSSKTSDSVPMGQREPTLLELTDLSVATGRVSSSEKLVNGGSPVRPTLHRQKTKQQLMVEPPPQDLSNPHVSFPMKIYHFYNAPVITFIHNCLSYIGFLALFSYILLTNFHRTLSWQEVILIIWIFSLLVEEIRQLITDESSSMRVKATNYIYDNWNRLDLIAIALFIIGLILRLMPASTCANCFDAGRIILAIDLMTFFFRLLHIFSVHKEMGPKLVMIGRMMIDLFFFMIILVVFITAYGLASQVILYPNSELNIGLIQSIWRKAYWQMYGELFLEEIEGKEDCTNNPLLYGNGTLPRCPANTWVVPILLGGYILITNILMLNLLIAMFSFTFDKVQEKTEEYYLFERFFLIREYHERPPLAPPFIILSHAFQLVRAILSCTCGICKERPNAFKMDFSEPEVKQLILWENICADDYKRRTDKEEKESIDHRVKETNERVDILVSQVEELSENGLLSNNTTTEPKLPPVLDDRLTYIEQQMQRTSKALDWIIHSMCEKGAGGKGGPPALEDVDDLREKVKRQKAEDAQQKIKEFEDLLKKQLLLHVVSRTPVYPCDYANVMRTPLPDDKVDWQVDWPEYAPVNHTDRLLTEERPFWADKDLFELPVDQRTIPFNQYDSVGRINRKSFHPEGYKVVQGIPYNPSGRTGLSGRGVLGRWGPNHAGDPVVTRWKLDPATGQTMRFNGKPVLEFVSVQRPDTKQWAIPGGFVEPGDPVHKTLKAEFIEEAVGNQMDDVHKRDKINAEVNKLWEQKTLVYEGYVDDPRNTDNAWVETTVYNYHDETGDILYKFQIRAGDGVEVVRWQRLSSTQDVYGSHLSILQKVAELKGAAF